MGGGGVDHKFWPTLRKRRLINYDLKRVILQYSFDRYVFVQHKRIDEILGLYIIYVYMCYLPKDLF